MSLDLLRHLGLYSKTENYS